MSSRLDTARPARILYVINDLAVGGAQRVVLHQAGFLDRSLFTPIVASFEFDPSAELAPSFAALDVPVHRLRAASESPLRGFFRLERLLAVLEPDLVHTHLAAAGVLARLAARWRRVPRVVTTLHNLSDWEEKRQSPLRWLDRRTLPLADVVVTVSEAIRRAVARVQPGLAERTVTVHNGVPLEVLTARADRGAARTALGYLPEQFVVGAVARLDPRKGLDTLVEAMAIASRERPELRVLIVGDGPERGRLEELARTLGIESRLRIVRNHVEVRSMLAAMDLFAAPSRTEGLGMAIIEALAAGVPVLGSAVGGIPEVVEDGVCGRLLPPQQTRSWAEALVHLAGRPLELGRWSSAAPAVARRFSLAESGAELERLYRRLLALDRPAGVEARAA
jgi:glycosyltransferase involved in cell wall biosynthesis